MKVEVRCATCSRGFLVDEKVAHGELPCPGCGAEIDVGSTSEAPAAGPGGPARPARSKNAAAEITSPVARPLVAAAQPAAVQPADDRRSETSAGGIEQVVCPRCNLHFSPRRAETRTVTKERQTILIVEDMNYFREIAADALGDDYEIRLAGTVDGARSILAQGGIDLLILDLTLDGGDHGLDLMREMTFKPCPILIYTAQDESEMYGDSWEELQKLGADDIVIKGMNVAESLVRKVGTMLGKSWDDED